MAGDWLQIDHELPNKPEVVQMAAVLDLDRFAVAGRLIALWGWFDSHTKDGRAPESSREFLDALCACAGFISALEKVEWVFVKECYGVPWLCVTKFGRYMSNSAKTRALAARRASRSRRNKRHDARAPREEKRREEKSTSVGTLKSDSKTKLKRSYSPAFERWWSAYPRKTSKLEASKAYSKAGARIVTDDGISREQAVAKLQTASEAFAASDSGQSQFCPHPATWLNQGRYDDDPSAWKERAPASAVRPALDLGDDQ